MKATTMTTLTLSRHALAALANDEGDALDPVIRRMSTRDLASRSSAARATLRALAAALTEHEEP